MRSWLCCGLKSEGIFITQVPKTVSKNYKRTCISGGPSSRSLPPARQQHSLERKRLRNRTKQDTNRKDTGTGKLVQEDCA